MFYVTVLGFSFGNMNAAMAARICRGPAQTKPLSFLNEFFEPMAKGEKVATTRKGERCYRVGSVVPAINEQKEEVGSLKIKKVRVIKFSEIDASLAKAEGATVKELKEGLVEIYGEEIKKADLTAIYFDYRK